MCILPPAIVDALDAIPRKELEEYLDERRGKEVFKELPLMSETRWIVLFNSNYDDGYIGKKVRELLQIADATSIHVEKWTEEEMAKIKAQTLPNKENRSKENV